MKFEDRIQWVRRIWQNANPESIEALVLHSSYLIFDRSDETLFRPGDAPQGFYWILSGSVQQSAGDQNILSVQHGAMIGLEEFLQHRLHQFHWRNLCRTEALFMDQRCFDLVAGNEQGFIYNQLAKQLLDIKIRYRHLDTDHFSRSN